MPSESEKLARWLRNVSLTDVGDDVITNTKLRILDHVGVMFGTSDHDTVLGAANATDLVDDGGAYHDMAHQRKMGLASAALVNGAMASVLEFDDTHIQSNIHPTGVVLSALLPLCQKRVVTGRELINAVLVGSELLCRIGLVSPVRLHEVGFHPTAVYGTFGAIYAIALLEGLDEETIVNAIGLAGSLTSGSISAFEDGTSAKVLHVGLSAASALRAVALAKQGITGPRKIYEGKFGLFRSYVQSAPDFRFEALYKDLGSEWEVLSIASKQYPCAYTLLPFIRCALDLRDAHEMALDQIEEIRCEIMERSFNTVCVPVEDKRRPKSTWHGRISLQHTVAEALVRRKMDKHAYAPDCLADPLINSLADKVRYYPDPIASADLTRSRARVTLKFKDGSEIAHAVVDMPGTRGNPLGTEAYLEKFDQNVDGVLSSVAATALKEKLLNLEAVDDVEALFSGLRH